jgi:hypothetical protein
MLYPVELGVRTNYAPDTTGYFLRQSGQAAYRKIIAQPRGGVNSGPPRL